MNRKENLNNENKVLNFLSNTEKKVILKLKYKKNKIDLLIERYLEVLPQFETKLLANSNQAALPCEYWITDLLNNIDEHCKHCTSYKNGRDFSNNKTACSKCLQNYRSFLEHFCQHCTKKNYKQNCTDTVFNLINNKLKRGSNTYLEPKASILFSVYAKFKPDISNIKYFNFDLFRVALKFAEAGTTENITYQKKILLKKFISGWIEVPEDMSPRNVFNIAFKIIAVHYLFVNDLLNFTYFNNSPKHASNSFIDDNHENSNVLLAYFMKLKNYSSTEIKSVIGQNINENQIVNLRYGNTNSIPEFSKKQIYSYPVLENVQFDDLPETQKNSIDEHKKKGNLRSTKVKISNTGAQIDRSVDMKYVEYMILVKFLSLIESIKRTRFTNKLPALFEGDSLIKLRNEMISDELDKECSMKQACKNLGLKYKTTHMAIDGKLIYHPNYDKLKKNPDYPKPPYNNYHKFTWIFENSTIEDLKKWIENVRKLKK